MKYEKNDIVEIIRSIQGNIYTVYTDWIKIAAISIHNSVHFNKDFEDDYVSICKRYSQKEIKLFAEAFGILQILMGEKYDDYLGSMYMILENGSKRTGQFFTPYHISQLLAKCQECKRMTTERIIINEPSCGGGANIIAFIEQLRNNGINYQNEYEIIAQDLDWNCVYMCYVQLSLYGVYGKVIQGDTLAEDSDQHVLYTPMYYLARGGCA